MFFSRTKAEWREVEGRMMVTAVTIIHHHDTTHLYRSSSRTKVVHGANEKGEPRDKVCKIAASFNSEMWKHVVSSSREGIRKTLTEDLEMVTSNGNQTCK